MSIIFLDWDGVINILEKQQVNQKSVEALNFITDGTGAKVVIISNRRVLGIDYFKKLFNQNNLRGEIIGIFPRMSFESRGDLIKEYFKNHQQCDYVVLDDKVSGYDAQMLRKHVIQPVSEVGLTMENARKAIKILTGW